MAHSFMIPLELMRQAVRLPIRASMWRRNTHQYVEIITRKSILADSKKLVTFARRIPL